MGYFSLMETFKCRNFFYCNLTFGIPAMQKKKCPPAHKPCKRGNYATVDRRLVTRLAVSGFRVLAVLRVVWKYSSSLS